MKTQDWTRLKKGCPLHTEGYCIVTGDYNYVRECRFQKKCPFVYWFRITESLIKYGRLV